MGKYDEEDEDSKFFVEDRSLSRNPKCRNIIIATVLGVVVVASIIGIVVWQIVIREDKPVIPTEPFARAKYLQGLAPLIDGHNDLPWQFHNKAQNDVRKLDISVNQPLIDTDIPRLTEGMLGAQFWSVYIACGTADPVQATVEQIDIVYQMAEVYPDTFEITYSTDQVATAFEAKKISSFMGMEGGHSINNSIGALRMLYRLGARYMTLTHSCSTPWAQSANDNSGNVIGLTDFGKQIVLEMNRLGMLVDLSHVAVQTMNDALDTTKAPVIFSHSNAWALCNHVRNVPDSVLKRLVDNGGVVMVVFYPGYVCQNWTESNRINCTLDNVVDHIDYIKNLVGIDHVGLGSDFDGVSDLATGLEDVSKYLDLTAALVRRGYSDEDILKVISQNSLRVLARAEEVADQMAQS